MPAGGLKRTLDRFYREYDFRGRLLHDPIELPHRYADPLDIEVTAFLACCLAYGKVDLFKPVAERILAAMGRRPGQFLRRFSLQRHAGLFRGIRYRFNRTEDILGLLHIMSSVIREHGSLERLFMRHYRSDDRNISTALAGAVADMLQIDTAVVYGKNIRPSGLVQFFPSPANGSTCKRHNLFLRWMVRDRDIDFGLWNGISKSALVIPLDTHIMRISQCLGLTTRRSPDWKTAVEVTDALRRFDPRDPLKYDFALCHHGISGLCAGRTDRTVCGHCAFSRHRTAA